MPNLASMPPELAGLICKHVRYPRFSSLTIILQAAQLDNLRHPPGCGCPKPKSHISAALTLLQTNRLFRYEAMRKVCKRVRIRLPYATESPEIEVWAERYPAPGKLFRMEFSPVLMLDVVHLEITPLVIGGMIMRRMEVGQSSCKC